MEESSVLPLKQPSTAMCSAATEALHTLANEPSIGLYYVCEHIQRSVPALVADKAALKQTTEQLQGADLDAGYALEDMKAATDGRAVSALANVEAMASALARRRS